LPTDTNLSTSPIVDRRQETRKLRTIKNTWKELRKIKKAWAGGLYVELLYDHVTGTTKDRRNKQRLRRW
jgi:hypothetical protein